MTCERDQPRLTLADERLAIRELFARGLTDRELARAEAVEAEMVRRQALEPHGAPDRAD